MCVPPLSSFLLPLRCPLSPLLSSPSSLIASALTHSYFYLFLLLTSTHSYYPLCVASYHMHHVHTFNLIFSFYSLLIIFPFLFTSPSYLPVACTLELPSLPPLSPHKIYSINIFSLWCSSTPLHLIIINERRKYYTYMHHHHLTHIFLFLHAQNNLQQETYKSLSDIHSLVPLG